MKNHYVVTDPSQFDSMKLRDSFEFTCKVCGKHTVIKSFTPSYLEKYKMMMCGPCRSSYIQKHMTPEQKAAKLARTRQTKLELYGDANYNNREQSAQTCLAKFGSTSPLGNKDIYNETCKTRLEKYGTENYVETDTFKTQKAETQLERYGDATYTNREQADKTFRANHDGVSFSEYTKQDFVKAEIAKTNTERYGGPSPMCSAEVRAISKQHKLEKYGDENYTNREQAAKTKMERYGDPHYNNPEKQALTAKKYGEQYNHVLEVPGVHDLGIAAIYKKYGVRSVLSLPETIEKSRQTKLEEYGDAEYRNQKQGRETRLRRYGRESGFTCRYNYFGMMFDSSWELAVWIYCIDHNIPIIRTPFAYEYITKSGKTKHYYPDFMINGKLVEIKGDHLIDEDGDLKKLYTDQSDEYTDSKQEIMSILGVAVWTQKDCENHIKYARYKYGYNYNQLFKVHNPNNPSYSTLNGFTPIMAPYLLMPIMYTYPIYANKGVTPFDLEGDKYTKPGLMVTPFDIKD